MVKRRVVAVVLVRQGRVVQSIGFRRHLPIGRPAIAVEHLNRWGADEIILLDMTAGREGGTIAEDLVETAAANCFVPLTVGGGLRTLADITRAIHHGADKISLNAAAVRDPALIRETALSFGRQAVVVSIDVGPGGDGRPRVFIDGGRIDTGLDPFDHARRCVDLGAGEILLNSIPRDGAKTGFDLPLIEAMTRAVTVPVIALGGAGRPDHFRQVFAIPGLSAAAAGNMFHFIEHSVMLTKAHIARHGIDVRGDAHVSHADTPLDAAGRTLKRPDDYLDELAYEYIVADVI